MKSALLVCLVCLGLAGATSWGAGPDDRYLEIYKLIQSADDLNNSADPRQAVVRYTEAAEALKAFAADHPTWNPKAVKFRAGYVEEKRQAVLKRFPAAAVHPSQPQQPAAPAVAVDAAALERIKSLEQQVALLTDQNARLEGRIREALSVNPAGADPRELAKAQAEVQRLENELRQAAARPAPQPAPAPAPVAPADSKTARQQSAELKRLEQSLAEVKAEKAALTKENAVLGRDKAALERERARLDQELQAAQKRDGERAAPRARAGTTRPNKEIETLKAKLAVYEAQAVPFTPEELALFSKVETSPVLTETNKSASAPKKPKANIPSGAGSLVAEAQRAYELGRHEEARTKFAQVLGQDENNPFLLTHLAAAEYALEQFSQAEGHVKRALEIDPEDAAGLYLMGMLRSREGDQEAALEALSRAAKIDPTNARTHNSIGLALVRKGQRKAAETAFRKAIQLDPGYGAAHFNLAVEYATQQPPSSQLARWHYQKAIASGHPRDPDLEKSMEAPPATATK